MDESSFIRLLEKHANEFHPLIKSVSNFKPVDLSKGNISLDKNIYCDILPFTKFIDDLRIKNGHAYLVGGYREERAIYERSWLFETKEHPRDLHLGIDIWGDAGTEIYAPLDGTVHSFANNKENGDYGATIILQHHLENVSFCTLYGHLSIADIQYLRKGQSIARGELFAHFGDVHENGNWPPHLHMQIIMDMGTSEGDYPGVCKVEEAYAYVPNSPDPTYLLKF